jgi:hypothetical protein
MLGRTRYHGRSAVNISSGANGAFGEHIESDGMRLEIARPGADQARGDQRMRTAGTLGRRSSATANRRTYAQQSFFETTATEKSFISCVLFYIGGFSFLTGVGMMFVLHQFIL